MFVVFCLFFVKPTKFEGEAIRIRLLIKVPLLSANKIIKRHNVVTHTTYIRWPLHIPTRNYTQRKNMMKSVMLNQIFI